MRLKDLFLICSIVLCLSFTNANASSIDYNLTIDENMQFHEKITYNVEQKDITTDGSYNFLSSIVNDPVYFDLKKEVEYKKTKINTANGYMITLQHEYSYLFLSKSRILNECFTDNQIDNTNEYISLDASDFYCSHRADNIKITINTDKKMKVIDSNATTTSNNMYIWSNITNDFSLSFKVQFPTVNSTPMDNVEEDTNNDNKDEDNQTEKSNNSSTVYTIIIASTAVFLLIGALILKRKNDKLNSI